MTLVQLEYVVAVDNFRHFGKAAKKCFVSQPTLSMQIQKLEEQLGVAIFDRGKQPIAPTHIGVEIIKQARVVLGESGKINEIIEREKGVVAGDLNVAIIPTLAPYLLPLFVTKFIKEYPKVNLHIEELVTEEVVKSVRQGITDIGIIVTPYGDSEIMEKPLFYEEFFAYIGLRHPLFENKTIGVDDISDDGLWLLNEGHCFRNQALNICHNRSKGEQKGFRYESGSLEGLKRIVDQHGGITLLPELATLDFNPLEKQKLRAFDDPKPKREVSLITGKNFSKTRLEEYLYQTISVSIPDYINSEKNGKIIKWK